MKKSLIIILFISAFNISYSQWVIQRPVTPGETLYDIQFINRYTGWACGDGLILKTTNGGSNWIEQSHPAMDKLLLGIHPVNNNVVYCVGYFETILKTTDGGSNWIALRNNPGNEGPSELAVFFINENTGWITRQDGGGFYNVLKTTNGGVTFDSIYVFHGYLNDIYFKDANTGLICGDGATVIKTTNGGINWVDTPIPHGGFIGNFLRISVVENRFCWVITEGLKKVYHSTDFGNSWDSLGYVTGADIIYCCGFSSRQIGWAGGSDGKFKTINGGINWIRDTVNMTNAFISSFWFYNDSIGWAVGGGGEILFTQTGGAISNINLASSKIPEGFSLHQNYPNPFNNQTVINFDITKKGDYSLTVYNILGKKVDEIYKGNLSHGSYKIYYNAENLTSGVYYYRLNSNDNIISKSFLLIK